MVAVKMGCSQGKYEENVMKTLLRSTTLTGSHWAPWRVPTPPPPPTKSPSQLTIYGHIN